MTPLSADYPRDLRGYGRTPPHAQWPGKARIAVQFVLNYEEGGENCVLHGDAGSEQFLSEMFNPASYPERHLSMESIYEYGSRAGVWRILREFERRGWPLTVFAVGMAMQRHPELATFAKHHLCTHFQPDSFVVAGELGIDFLAAFVIVVVHQCILGAHGHSSRGQASDHHHHRAEHQQPRPALTIPGHGGNRGGRLVHDALTLQ